MLIHEHIRIAAMRFGVWTESKVRHGVAYTTAGVGEQTARDRANNFAQLRRLAHHRYQLWKRQQRSQRSNVIPQITGHGSVGLPATPELEGVGNGSVAQERPAVTGPEASRVSGQQEIFSTPVDDVRPPQDTEEHHHKSLSTQDAMLESDQLQAPEEPQGCSQVRFQADESQITKRSTSIAPTCTPHESNIELQVRSTLSSVIFTDSPSFSAWTPCNKADEHCMSLSNVKFKECEQSDLQLKSSCDMANFAFIDCKFNRMSFMDVKLSNVTFKNVDFTRSAFYCLVLRNVTLINLRFENDLWRTTRLENALIGKENFKVCQGTITGCYLRAPAVSSKTIQFGVKDAKPLNKLNQELGHSGAWKRDIHRRFGPSKRNILTRLVEYRSISDRIMKLCFPGSNVHIYEYPRGFDIPRRPTVSTKLYSKRNGTKTTCFGSPKYGLSAIAEPSKTILPRGVGNCTGLFLVDKKLSQLALKHLFGRTFHLQCSAEGAREFLLAHAQQMKMAKVLVLYYHWADDKVGFVTDINAWRYLLGTIRHQLSFIPKIILYVGRTFWKRNRASESARSVLGDQSNVYCPLGDAHKFAAPDDRWRYKDNESTHRTDGTVLQLHIEDTSNQIKTDFVRNMFVEIERQRVGRPLFVKSPNGEEITYRCANQFRGE